jgi:curli biogenesis system outer membrane secretion channel CsgG
MNRSVTRILFAAVLAAAVTLPSTSAPNETAAASATTTTSTSTVATPPPATPPTLLRIAVLDFENKVPNGQADIGSGMADMLIRELKKTGRYTVLERAALAEVLGEQDLTNSGRVQRGQQIAIGRVKGAQLLIKGAVTEFSYDVKDRNAGIGYRGWGLGWTEARARIAADIRLIDAMTGEIIQAYDEATEVKSTGASVAGTVSGFSFSAGGNENHPLGQAARQLIDRMVNQITRRLDTGTIEVLVSQGFEARIVKADDLQRIVISRGFSDGVKVGDRLQVNRVTEELTDPQTGEVLGVQKLSIGTIEITSVQERFAEARAISGSGFMRNDVVIK